jgi:RNA ligase
VSDTDVLHRFTPLTEIVYPDNRIVCDYGDTDDLFLLGGVWIDDGRYVGPAEAAEITGWTGPQAPTFAYPTFADALAAPPRPGAEGLCVRYRDQPRIVKIKQEDYVALHKIVTGLSERTVWETLSADADGLNGLLGGLPDELHAWTREVWQRLVADLDALTGDVIASRDAITATLTRGFGRKEFALEAVRHRHRPYLFLALDEQYDRMRSVILADLKPAGDTRPRSRGEDVA